MLASASASGILKPSVLTHANNLRRRMKVAPRLSDSSTGNLIWFAATAYIPAEKDVELHHLASLVRPGMEKFSADYFESVQGEEGFKVASEQLNQVAEFASKTNAEVYNFSSWLNFGFNRVDFGWGKPSWICIPGVVTAYTNFIYFTEIIGEDNAVDAWVTLDEKYMGVLEHDHEFLEFAFPDPLYDKVKI